MKLGDLRGRAVRGTWFHAPVVGEIEVLADTIVVIDAAGVIDTVLRPGAAGHDAAARDAFDARGAVLLPGFIDLHVHAPQYPQLGQALDEPLEVWLDKYTFPLEARYADLDFARPRYDTLVREPAYAMRMVYEFTGLPPFEHDFENVAFDADEFDARLGTPGLHTVRRRVGPVADRTTILPPDIWTRYEGASVWRDPAFNTRGVHLV